MMKMESQISTNSLLDASVDVDNAQDNLKKIICEMTDTKIFRGILFTRAFSLAARIQNGIPREKALKLVGLDNFSDETNISNYCNLCVNLRKATDRVFFESYMMVVEDRGWPRRAHHSAHQLSIQKGEKLGAYRPEKWFFQQKIKAKCVGKINKTCPWNTVYHPDIPIHGLTIAITRTPDTVFIEYDPEMTFFELVMKVIQKYPSANGRLICPENTVFELGGRVLVCRRRESLRSHYIIDGSLLSMTPGVHSKNKKDCCE